MQRSYWLLKSEPETYSFQRLLKEKKTNWNGVRNFQARKFLKEIKKGDLAFIYHSGDEKAVVGIARIIKEAYPDLDPQKPGEWVQVDLEPVEALKRPVSLKEIKATRNLAEILLIKQSRLSVMPIQAKHYETLLQLGNQK